MFATPIFNWYVIYTYPNFEKKIQQSLLKKNIMCFLPLQKMMRQWSDRKKVIEVPLFPNYVFVYISNLERFRVLDILGVSRYISYNGSPAIISDDAISKIKKMMHGPDIVIENYLEGDLIKIIDGPFTGLTGIVFERKGKKRFGIRIEAINQCLSVELNATSIKKLEQPAYA
jgi:transcriptional antiterminator RfaH